MAGPGRGGGFETVKGAWPVGTMTYWLNTLSSFAMQLKNITSVR